MEDRSEELPITEQQHALQIPVIAKHIFNFWLPTASLKDVKNVRLVCRAWHEETLSWWRRNAVLTFYDYLMFASAKPHRGVSPHQFLGELQNPGSFFRLEEKPFEKYKFHNHTIDLKNMDKNRDAVAFWKTVGPLIKHLTLKNVHFKTWFRKIEERGYSFGDSEYRYFLSTKFPNLESLNEDGIIVEEPCEGRYPHYRQQEAHLVVNLPKVTKIKLRTAKGFRFCNFPKLEHVTLGEFARLLNLWYPGKNITIKTLNLMDGDFQHAGSVSMYFPSLENLALQVKMDEESMWARMEFPGLFRPLVHRHSDTLKTLDLYQWIGYLPPDTLPITRYFPVLTQFRVWGTLVKDLCFLKFMPNLQRLHVDAYAFGKAKSVRYEADWHCHGSVGNREEITRLVNLDPVKATLEKGDLAGLVLPKMEYLLIRCRLPPECIQALGTWMPNLKTLKCILDSCAFKSFLVVCDTWPKLERLHCLFDSHVTDTDIVPPTNDNKELVVKGLVHLKNLKSFRFESQCFASALTDAVVETGFLQMPELTDLRICVSEDFSKKAEALLSTRVQNVQIIRNHMANPEHDGSWKCCQNRSYSLFVIKNMGRHNPEERGFMFSPRRRPSATYTEDESDVESDEESTDNEASDEEPDLPSPPSSPDEYEEDSD